MTQKETDLIVSILNLLVEEEDYNIDEFGFGYNRETLEISYADGSLEEGLESTFKELCARVNEESNEITNKDVCTIASRIVVWVKNHPDDKTPIHNACSFYKDFSYEDYVNIAKDLMSSTETEGIIPTMTISKLDGTWVENGISLTNFEDL